MPEPGSTQPYLIRAIYEWAVDNGLTPHLLVDAQVPGVHVPQAYVQDGRIALNIHPQAVERLELGRDAIVFAARFGGRSFEVDVPVNAVLAIYARENGHGFSFQKESERDGTASGGGDPSPPAPPGGKPSGGKGATLRRVK